MTRSVPEWIGANDDTPIPPRVKERIVLRQDYICGCGCGMELGRCGEAIEFDHTQALANGGENRESNLRALRRPCHQIKTRADVDEKSRVSRKRKANLGFKPKKRKIPYRKFDNTPVWPKRN